MLRLGLLPSTCDIQTPHRQLCTPAQNASVSAVFSAALGALEALAVNVLYTLTLILTHNWVVAIAVRQGR